MQKRTPDLADLRCPRCRSRSGSHPVRWIDRAVEEGDEVLCSDLTFVASVNAALYVGAKPVFVDAERGLFWDLCDGDLATAFAQAIEIVDPQEKAA